MDAPEHLKPGFYFIAASHDKDFRESDNVISMTDVWVSDLALITRTRARQIEGFVLEANSGEPVGGAEISVWHLDQNGHRVADPKLASDENGFFSMKPKENIGYLFRARQNKRASPPRKTNGGIGGLNPASNNRMRRRFFSPTARFIGLGR